MRLLLAAALAPAVCFSIRFALADHYFRADTLESVRQAIGLAPGNTRYLLRLARLEPTNPNPLEQAVRENPHAAAARIELGLRAEGARQHLSAEAHLLEAARMDAGFLPRWTLANFYLRRGRQPQFWHWIREASRMSFGDSTALNQLCWRIRPDPDWLLEHVIADKPESLYWHYYFLLAQDQIPAAGRALLRLAAHNRPQDGAEVPAFCERALEAQRTKAAIEVWNRSIDGGLLGFRKLDPARGESLTNPGFATRPTSRGFDWRLPSASGVTVAWPAAGGLIVEFDGRQKDHCEILSQILPLARGRRYRLRYRYEIEPAAATGLRWRLDGPRAETSRSIGAGTEGTFEFDAPADRDAARLILGYERELATTRWEGRLRLERVELALIVLP